MGKNSEFWQKNFRILTKNFQSDKILNQQIFRSQNNDSEFCQTYQNNCQTCQQNIWGLWLRSVRIWYRKCEDLYICGPRSILLWLIGQSPFSRYSKVPPESAPARSFLRIGRSRSSGSRKNQILISHFQIVWIWIRKCIYLIFDF